MDKSIIRDFAKLRVLTPYDVQRMDDLVQDLTNALEETSSCTNAAMLKRSTRRRGSRRRRPGAVLKMSSSPAALGFLSSPRSAADASLHLASEDSVSSLDETGMGKSPAEHHHGHQSDSDCCLVSGSRPVMARSFSQGIPAGHRSGLLVGSFVESDSVNENFSPVRPHRRKRKFKRMAVDPSVTMPSSNDQQSSLVSMRSPSEMLAIQLRAAGRSKVEKSSSSLLWRGTDLRGCFDANGLQSPILAGKRKHSMRERSVELLEGDIALQVAGKNLGSMFIYDDPDVEQTETGDQSLQLARVIAERQQIGLNGTMDCLVDGISDKLVDSSSSLSSSESDAGIYTNDEGREGDDEQSDFYHEGADPACGIPGVLPWWGTSERDLVMDEEERASEETFQAILTGCFKHMSDDAKHACKNEMYRFMPGREIRAGRRRLRDRRPGFSIISSVNEKISKFLQNPEQNELKLYPMKKKEMDQLVHLASLYSLNMHYCESSNQDILPVLTKTRNTTQVVNLDKIGVSTLWNRSVANDIKRQRRTPPTSPRTEAEPIPEDNVGNVMLRSMGWEPGTGLGTKQDGIKTPVAAHARPRLHGLGYKPSTSK